MKQETTKTLETAAISAAAVTASWTLQDVSTMMSITVSVLSATWLFLQIIKFCVRWWQASHKVEITSFGDTAK